MSQSTGGLPTADQFYEADGAKRVLDFDSPVKSPSAAMPDLIRHPEPLEFTGFRLSPE